MGSEHDKGIELHDASMSFITPPFGMILEEAGETILAIQFWVKITKQEADRLSEMNKDGKKFKLFFEPYT